MRIIKFFSSLIIASLISLLFLQATPVSAASSTTLQISPVVVNIKAGEQFTLTTKAIPVGGKNYTVRFSIKFMPELVSVQNWTYAGIWMPVNQPGFEELNNNTGVLVRTAGYPGGFDSVANFGTVTFLAKKTGVTSIFIDKESFSLDADGKNVAVIAPPSIVNIAADVVPVAAPVATPIIAPDPIPVVTPTPVPEPVPVPDVPVVVPVAPTQLFDIKLNVNNNTVLNKSSDLVAQLTFESFGTVPTPVDLTYRILDSNNKEVYNEKGNITVETERVLTKEFKELKLESGKYTLIVNTKYGTNVSDDFRQMFEVKGVIVLGMNITTIALIVGALVLIAIGLAIYFIFRKKIILRIVLRMKSQRESKNKK